MMSHSGKLHAGPPPPMLTRMMWPPLPSRHEWFLSLSILLQYCQVTHERIYSKMTHPSYEEITWSQIPIEVYIYFLKQDST